MRNDLIGQRIKDARKQLGLTQEQLAADVFISESYMTLIEQGKRSMSLDILVKITARLGLTEDFLLNGDDGSLEAKIFRDWLQLVKGRNESEVKAAHEVIRSFFTCLDKESNKDR